MERILFACSVLQRERDKQVDNTEDPGGQPFAFNKGNCFADFQSKINHNVPPYQISDPVPRGRRIQDLRIQLSLLIIFFQTKGVESTIRIPDFAN